MNKYCKYCGIDFIRSERKIGCFLYRKQMRRNHKWVDGDAEMVAQIKNNMIYGHPFPEGVRTTTKESLSQQREKQEEDK